MLGRKIGGEWEPALAEEERCKPSDHSDARFDPVSHRVWTHTPTRLARKSISEK